jgi:hypothetical protein
MTSHSTVSLNLSIADIPVTLRLYALDEPMRARILERYAAFMTPPSSAAISIDVHVEPGPEYIPFGLSSTWQIKSSMQACRLEFESHLENGWVDFGSGRGALTLRPTGDTENFLRVLYAWQCLERDALVLHSSGIIRQGQGYVFFGPSGSGKTTLSRLSLDHTVLSDDLVIVKKCGPAFRVYGVPFRGDMPEAPRTNAVADLRGLFMLVKASEHRVTPVPAPEAVARLSACVPFVMAQPANARRVAEFCAALAAAVPVRALHFRRDAGFWSVIDGLY